MNLHPVLKILVLVVLVAFAGTVLATETVKQEAKPEAPKTTTQCCAKGKTDAKCDPAKCTGDPKTCAVKDCDKHCTTDKQATCTKSNEKQATETKGTCGTKCPSTCPAAKDCHPK
ncbi:MAG: hypothetical protein R3F48_09475 [Candidatus Zixiibacteriota bacterium]